MESFGTPSDPFKEIGITSFSERDKRAKATLVNKSLNHEVPSYIRDKLVCT